MSAPVGSGEAGDGHARQFVVQHYSWPAITQRYAQMYDRVLASVRA
ncbi:hypothetical protein ABZW30_34415 [Kitasatospora sp. NPDC004669]